MSCSILMSFRCAFASCICAALFILQVRIAACSCFAAIGEDDWQKLWGVEDETVDFNAMSKQDRDAKIREMGEAISKEATEGNHYDADVKSFFHGNEFYLFVYDVAVSFSRSFS